MNRFFDFLIISAVFLFITECKRKKSINKLKNSEKESLALNTEVISLKADKSSYYKVLKVKNDTKKVSYLDYKICSDKNSCKTGLVIGQDPFICEELTNNIYSFEFKKCFLNESNGKKECHQQKKIKINIEGQADKKENKSFQSFQKICKTKKKLQEILFLAKKKSVNNLDIFNEFLKEENEQNNNNIKNDLKNIFSEVESLDKYLFISLYFKNLSEESSNSFNLTGNEDSLLNDCEYLTPKNNDPNKVYANYCKAAKSFIPDAGILYLETVLTNFNEFIRVWAVNQNKSVRDLYKKGVRWFDIRLMTIEKDLIGFRHGEVFWGDKAHNFDTFLDDTNNLISNIDSDFIVLDFSSTQNDIYPEKFFNSINSNIHKRLLIPCTGSSCLNNIAIENPLRNKIYIILPVTSNWLMSYCEFSTNNNTYTGSFKPSIPKDTPEENCQDYIKDNITDLNILRYKYYNSHYSLSSYNFNTEHGFKPKDLISTKKHLIHFHGNKKKEGLDNKDLSFIYEGSAHVEGDIILNQIISSITKNQFGLYNFTLNNDIHDGASAFYKEYKGSINIINTDFSEEFIKNTGYEYEYDPNTAFREQTLVGAHDAMTYMISGDEQKMVHEKFGSKILGVSLLLMLGTVTMILSYKLFKKSYQYFKSAFSKKLENTGLSKNNKLNTITSPLLNKKISDFDPLVKKKGSSFDTSKMTETKVKSNTAQVETKSKNFLNPKKLLKVQPQQQQLLLQQLFLLHHSLRQASLLFSHPRYK